jgi:hypothetical protein
VWEFSFGDFLVLSPPGAGELYLANQSAAYAWQLLRDSKSLPEAALAFANRYDIPVTVAARDLHEVWREWERTLFASTPSPASVPPPSPPLDCSSHLFSRLYGLFGKTIRVILDDRDLIAEISPRIESLLAPSDSLPDATLHATVSGCTYHVFSGAAWVCSRDHPADARVAFLQEFARTAEASHDWIAILHAGACGTEDRCVVFPAATHSGKTTLAAALMHAGMTFYADDSVGLRRDSLRIPSMPFALMIREGSWPAISSRFPEFQAGPVYERYGENVRFLHPAFPPQNRNAVAAALVFSRWEAGAGTAIEPLGAAETLMRLNESGFWVEHDRGSIQSVLDWIQSLPSYEMIYSDLDDAVAFVRTLLS